MLGPHSLNTLPGKTTKTTETIYLIYVQHVEGFHLDFWPNSWFLLSDYRNDGREELSSVLWHA